MIRYPQIFNRCFHCTLCDDCDLCLGCVALGRTCIHPHALRFAEHYNLEYMESFINRAESVLVEIAAEQNMYAVYLITHFLLLFDLFCCSISPVSPSPEKSLCSLRSRDAGSRSSTATLAVRKLSRLSRRDKSSCHHCQKSTPAAHIVCVIATW